MSGNHSGYIQLEKGKLHYLRMGNGKRLVFAFHGYANNATLFYPFQKYLQNDFTIISIDLPHHGKSVWDENILLQKKDLVELTKQMMTKFQVSKFCLIGYSLGGRVCLAITELMPEKIDGVVLIASDGLVFNPLYYFVTKTFIGRRLFRNLLIAPDRYLKFMDWLRHKKWLNETRYRFATYYLESDADRSFLLRVWPGMSLILPNMKRLRQAIRDHHLPVFIFMGSYDKIIPLPHAYRFKKDLNSVQLFILEKGHRVFDATSLPQMADCLIKGTC